MGIIRYLDTDPLLFISLVICLIFSLCFHEYSHGIVAYYFGDDTAYKYGRLTLNPFAHLDVIGSILILFIGIGYAKPVPVNQLKLRNPRTDIVKVAAAGPISNLLLCFIGILIFHLLKTNIDHTVSLFLQIFISINAALAVFNLLPVYPLDGGQIFGNLLSYKYPKYSNYLLEYGPKILFGIILFGIITGYSILWIIISPVINFIITFFESIIILIMKILNVF